MLYKATLTFLSGITLLNILSSGVSAMEEDVREPIFLRIPPSSQPFRLPDGSQVHHNPSREVWVQTPSQAYPATPWEQYAREKRLNMRAQIEESLVADTPVLELLTGAGPFPLPDGSEGTFNSSHEVWVQMPGEAYYATPWDAYKAKTNITINPNINLRPEAPVKLHITRASALFVIPLSQGDELHVNADNQIWVKKAGHSFPRTYWADYAYGLGLNTVWPEVETGALDGVELRIKRGTSSFWLPGGYEAAVNESDEVWIKTPEQSHYATPFSAFAEELFKEKNLRLTASIQP